MTYFTTGAQLQDALNALPSTKTGSFIAFNPFFYGQQYMGAYGGTLSPIEHFVQIGADRGYKPNATFDPTYYKNAFADLKNTNLNAADLLYHFMQYGLDEGRTPNAELATFNGAAYLVANPDVAAYVNANLAQFNNSVSNGALAHYVKFGQYEGRTDEDTTAGGTFRLTTGQDFLNGTANNDVFNGNVFDNQNTFQSGDEVSGGDGSDTLNITLGVSSSFAIAGITDSVEIVNIRSQANNYSGNNGDNNVSAGGAADGDMNDNTVDAQDMRGVNQWWSVDARADLVIEDVRINDDQITSDIAIGWSNADPSSRNDGNYSDEFADKVDYEVYFSPESLRKAADTASNVITLTVGNQVQTGAFDPANPLKDIPYTNVAFDVNGQRVTLNLDLADVTTYDQLWVAVQAGLAEAKASAEFGTLLANVTITRSVGTDSFFSKDGVLRFADEYALAITNGSITPAAVGWFANGGLPSDNAFGANVELGDATVTSDLITSTVFLDNVGRESEAGDLVIGSMSTRTGVERFEITVLNNDNTSGEYTSSGSWVGGMRSTNNFLREVIAVNGALGASGPDYLYVGTGMDEANNNLDTIRETFLSTQSTVAGRAAYQAKLDAALLNTDGLVDVRLFDASAMTGQVKVGARITEESLQKYQDYVDTAVNDEADDVEFAYLTGSGNDSINLEIDGAISGYKAWNGAGIEPSARHDFDFLVDGGAGNDHIQVALIEDSYKGVSSWYIDQAINENVTVNGGAGDDTIRTPGAGDMFINGDAGNDTIYTDNTGFDSDSYMYAADPVTGDVYYNDGRAAWVFNSVNNDIVDLQSEVPASVSAVNAQLTVSYRGVTKTVDIANSVGSLVNVAINDTDVNQAIKNAINNDAVLSKLLVAEDAAGRTLAVRSLIDGETDNDLIQGLTVTFKTAAFTASQLAAVSAGLVGFESATGVAAVTDGYVFADADNYADADGTIDGENSYDTPSDNTVTGGAGNDVIVLSTTQFGNDYSLDYLEGSNETVVYNTAGFGNDTIVNFDTTLIPAGATTYSGKPAVREVVTLTFGPSDGSPAAQTIIFDGSTVNLSAPATQGVIPGVDVAYQFATSYTANNWIATHTPGTNVVTLSAATLGSPSDGVVTDLVAGDFTGTYFGAANGNGTVTVATTTQGADAIVVGTQSSFTVDFDVAGTAASAAGAFTFDGATVNYAIGDGAITLASKLAAASFANWTVANNDDGSVTFTAKAPGATAIGVDADFDLGTVTIVGAVTGAVGTANTGTPIVTTSPGGPGAGYDILDFSGLGGTDFVGAGISETNGSITVAAETGATDTPAEIAALYTTDSATATKHIYIAYNGNNVGNVYQVVDAAGTGAGSTTATLVGTIDLADTSWASLTAVNFA
jgi:hypothetical protein